MDEKIKTKIAEEIGLLPSDGQRLKKFRKVILDLYSDDSNVEEVKQLFATYLDEFVANQNIILDNGMLYPGENKIGEENSSVFNNKKLSKKRSNVDSLNDTETSNEKKKIVIVAGSESNELWKNGEQAWKDGAFDLGYLRNNPDRITRLFCGNLKIDITEEQLRNAIPGITHIKWMTDKHTREFYGSTFLEMKDVKSASEAVMMDKTKLLGRPLKIYYCPPRPGDVWPPNDSKVSSGGKPNASIGTKPQSLTIVREKPEGCRKLFCGNLSYNIDDETLCDFFKNCGELTGLRWLTHKDSGDFRGCCFIEFASTQTADKAILLNGQELLGR